MTDSEMYEVYETERKDGESFAEFKGRIMNEMTMEEVDAILAANGLMHWKDGLYLITPAMFYKLPRWFMLTDIFGKAFFVKIDEIDLDTRLGMIAYGVQHLDDKIKLIESLGFSTGK